MCDDNLLTEQSYAFELFKQKKNLFITGPAGTGKTKLIHTFVEYTRMQGGAMQVCALTGCATLLLNCNAKTIHSWSGIKVARGTKAEIANKVVRNRFIANNWKKINILIVDEVSMLSQKMFEILNSIAKQTRSRPHEPFGGIQVIFTGDFFQLPPVGSPEEPDTCQFCFQSPEWEFVFPIEQHVELKTIFRQNDPLYVNILSQIRVGQIDEESIQVLNKYVNRPAVVDGTATGTAVPPKLFPLRKKTEYINSVMFDKIIEPTYEFHCDVKKNNEIYLDTMKPIPADILKECRKKTDAMEEDKILDMYLNVFPCAKIISLKKGFSVMCVHNLDLTIGICNGSQGIVIDFLETEEDATPIVKFSNGVVRPIQYKYWQMEETPTWSIGQIPLILSWAMTIHKTQGMTISMAEIDVGNTVFEYGQIYVALSRVKSLDGLYLLNFNPQKIKANPLVIDFYKKMFDCNRRMTPDAVAADPAPAAAAVKQIKYFSLFAKKGTA